MHAKLLLVLLGVGLAAYSTLVFAQPVDPTGTMAPTTGFDAQRKAADGYARRYGERGSPNYNAALRQAYQVLAQSDDIGSLADGIRSLDVKDSTAVEEDPAPQLIDSDPRLMSALLALPPVEIVANTRLRVTNPTRLTSNFLAATGLLRKDDGNICCSGVLIGTKTVVTAAHCVCECALDPRGLRAAFGYEPAREGRVRLVSDIRLPIGVRCEGSGVSEEEAVRSRKGRDIAVLTLTRAPEISFAASVASFATTAERASLSILEDGLVVVGYGDTSNAGTGSGQRNGTRVPIVSTTCSDALDARYDCVRGREMVALATEPNLQTGQRPDACFADSGGPGFLVIKRAEIFRLTAIVSRGLTSTCGSGTIYTLVTKDLVEDLAKKGVKWK